MAENKKTVVVIGLGRFGSMFAKKAANLGHDVIAIDHNPKNIENIQEFLSVYAVADIKTDGKNILRKLGAENADVGVVAIGTDISASAISVLELEEIGVSSIIAKASDTEHIRILEKMGVDNIISPEKDAGVAMAYVKLLGGKAVIHDLQGTYIDMFVLEIDAPKKLWNVAVRHSRLREDFQMTLVGIRRDGKLIVIPSPDEEIQEGDKLLLAASSKAIDTFVRKFIPLDTSGIVLNIGLGRFGFNFVKKAYDLGYDVIAIDKDENKVNAVKNYVRLAASMNIADDTGLEALRSLVNRPPMLSAIATGEDLASSLMGVFHSMDVGAMDFAVKALSAPHVKVLMKIGLRYTQAKTKEKQIVLPEEEAGSSSALQVLEGKVMGLEGVFLSIIYVPSTLIGKKVRESGLREFHRLTLVGIIRDNDFIPVPSPDEEFQVGDRLLIMGAKEHLDAYKEHIGAE